MRWMTKRRRYLISVMRWILKAISGAILSITDSAGQALKSAVITVNPMQSGSGTPSPENVRPFVALTRCGLAVSDTSPVTGSTSAFYKMIQFMPTQSGTGDPTPYNVRPISPGLTFVRDDDSTLSIYGGYVDPIAKKLYERYVAVSPSYSLRDYTVSGVTYRCARWTYSNSSYEIYNVGSISNKFIFWLSAHNIPNFSYRRTSEGVVYVYFTYGAYTDDEIRTFMAGSVFTLMRKTPTVYDLSDAELARALTALNIDCDVFAVSFPAAAQPVYAGSCDLAAGELKTRPYYASYNGETLVGPWVSSMDEYAANTTPTTGAAVVDLGGEETVYTFTPVEVGTNEGTNYIWADTGNIEIQYYAAPN